MVEKRDEDVCVVSAETHHPDGSGTFSVLHHDTSFFIFFFWFDGYQRFHMSAGQNKTFTHTAAPLGAQRDS